MKIKFIIIGLLILIINVNADSITYKGNYQLLTYNATGSELVLNSTDRINYSSDIFIELKYPLANKTMKTFFTKVLTVNKLEYVFFSLFGLIVVIALIYIFVKWIL